MYQWMSKKQMIDKYGEAKGLANIVEFSKPEKRAERRRADQDTGLDDDDNAEFKNYFDTGGDREVIKTNKNIARTNET